MDEKEKRDPEEAKADAEAEGETVEHEMSETPAEEAEEKETGEEEHKDSEPEETDVYRSIMNNSVDIQLAAEYIKKIKDEQTKKDSEHLSQIGDLQANLEKIRQQYIDDFMGGTGGQAAEVSKVQTEQKEDLDFDAKNLTKSEKLDKVVDAWLEKGPEGDENTNKEKE